MDTTTLSLTNIENSIKINAFHIFSVEISSLNSLLRTSVKQNEDHNGNWNDWAKTILPIIDKNSDSANKQIVDVISSTGKTLPQSEQTDFEHWAENYLAGLSKKYATQTNALVTKIDEYLKANYKPSHETLWEVIGGWAKDAWTYVCHDIFNCDNDKRKARLIELSSDTQGFLTQSKTYYNEFKQLNTEVNQKIAAICKKASIPVPSISPVTILNNEHDLKNINTADKVIDISDIVLDVGGFAATALVFAPAATTALVDLGVLSAEAASTVLFSALGVEIVAGTLVGGIVGGIVVGVIIVGVELIIKIFESAEIRKELTKGIHQTYLLRTKVKLDLDKSKALRDLLQSVKTTCDSLLSESIPLTEAIIKNLIQKDAKPALDKLNLVTQASVITQLEALDKSRNSWTTDDVSNQ